MTSYITPTTSEVSRSLSPCSVRGRLDHPCETNSELSDVRSCFGALRVRVALVPSDDEDASASYELVDAILQYKAAASGR